MMTTDTVYSHCNLCLGQCGVEITVDRTSNSVLSIEPDRQNPYAWQDFCRKGRTANEMVTHPRRITTPMRRVGDSFVPATYEEAVADISARLNRIIDEHGADAVGSYQGNPMSHCFTASTFYTGLLEAIGTGNRYFVGSVDTNAFFVVAKEMFGSELMILTSDVDECRCFLLVGMDPAVSKLAWVDTAANGWNRVLEAQAKGADVIVVDPRKTASAMLADTHVPVIPGQDWAFLLGLVKVIFDERLERPSTAIGLNGVEIVRALAADADLDDLAFRCGIDVDVIRDVARRFATSPTGYCATHTGVGHSETGTIGEWFGWVLNCVTGRLDVPGGRRFERGYLDLQAIASIITPAATHRSRLRDLPTIGGFHSLAELADEISVPGQEQIRALFLAMGNPVVSGADGRALDAAMEGLDLLVSIDLVQRESHRHADWLIPGTHWLERDEINPLMGTMSDQPYAHYARGAVEPPEGVREEWRFFLDLALAMKRPLFGLRGVNTVIGLTRLAARLTKNPKLAFDPKWTEPLLVGIGRRVRLRDIKKHPHGLIYAKKSYGDLKKAIRTPDKRVQCAPPRLVAECRRLLATSPDSANPDYPLLMINQRRLESINSWINDLPGVHQRNRVNDLLIHADDARELRIGDGQRVRVSSATSSIETVASITDGIRPGVVCIAHGWGSRVFDPVGGADPQSFGSNRNLLISTSTLDPLSQMPALNSTPVSVHPI